MFNELWLKFGGSFDNCDTRQIKVLKIADIVRQYPHCYALNGGSTITEPVIVLIASWTRHRASTSTCWYFAFGLCCHSNETRALVANPPNTAQLEGIPYHSPSYIRVCVVMYECGDWQTDRQTDRHTNTQTRVTNIHFASSTTHAKCNKCSTVAEMGHNRHGPKIGEGCAPLGEEELGPHLTQCGQGWVLPPCQVFYWSIQPFGNSRHGPRIIRTQAKLAPINFESGRVLCRFPWGAGSHLTQCGAETHLYAKFHLDPSNRLATIHQHHRQDRQDRTDRQRSDRIGRTVFTNNRPKTLRKRDKR